MGQRRRNMAVTRKTSGYTVGAIWSGQKLEKAAQKQTEKMRKSNAGIWLARGCQRRSAQFGEKN